MRGLSAIMGVLSAIMGVLSAIMGALSAIMSVLSAIRLKPTISAPPPDARLKVPGPHSIKAQKHSRDQGTR
ncbi:hypothetical protein [Bacillus weihaiensis]|uniref:Uncharacterized protein n=1 Tax=Bacillus weihaiensis TaxID=1547283 RepID=A0A1L3MUT7_9BACI|nr:hypothetical protein [Bacillus weihaiensis]APH06111.1 hypothetical protein A9C19_15940 [Bacillus weihaiensis]